GAPGDGSGRWEVNRTSAAMPAWLTPTVSVFRVDRGEESYLTKCHQPQAVVICAGSMESASTVADLPATPFSQHWHCMGFPSDAGGWHFSWRLFWSRHTSSAPQVCDSELQVPTLPTKQCFPQPPLNEASATTTTNERVFRLFTMPRIISASPCYCPFDGAEHFCCDHGPFVGSRARSR